MKRGVNPVQSGNYGGCDERKGWIYGDGPTANACEMDLRRMQCGVTAGGMASEACENSVHGDQRDPLGVSEILYRRWTESRYDDT